MNPETPVAAPAETMQPMQYVPLSMQSPLQPRPNEAAGNAAPMNTHVHQLPPYLQRPPMVAAAPVDAAEAPQQYHAPSAPVQYICDRHQQPMQIVPPMTAAYPPTTNFTVAAPTEGLTTQSDLLDKTFDDVLRNNKLAITTSGNCGRKGLYRVKRYHGGKCGGCNACCGGCCDLGRGCGCCNKDGCCDRRRTVYRRYSGGSDASVWSARTAVKISRGRKGCC